MAGSDVAVQARISVACARLGSLTTYDRRPSSRHTSSVTVLARTDGTVEVQLARSTIAARQLLARPVASLHVEPDGCEPVLLHGSVRRLPGLGERGGLVFHLAVAAVRVGNPAVLLGGAAYAAADPDPLRDAAPAVLAHLNAGHTDALAACVRDRGHRAAFAYAIGLDAGGLTVVGVGGGGAGRVRLPFPAPLAEPRDLPVGLGRLLNVRCGCAASRPAAVDRCPDSADSRAGDAEGGRH
ncbi:MAG: DUF2470 domain-containing protein [Mycobacteriales bacterium]